MNIHSLEKNNRLYFKILSGFMFFYVVIVITCVINKEANTFIVPSKLTKNRFTKVIVDLKIPKPKEITPIKKIEKVLQEEKEKIVKIKKPKLKKKVKKLVEKMPIKKIKEEEQNLNDLGMLKILGALDDSVGGLGRVETEILMSSSNFIETDEVSNILFEESSSDDILADETLSDSEAESLENELSHRGDFLFNDTINIEQFKSSSDNAILLSEKEEDGVRTPEFIEEKVSNYAEGIKFCYNNRLGLSERPSGKIIINFLILSSGKTDAIKIVSNEIRDSRLNNCITDVVRRWKFPFSVTDEVLVTYPLYLSAEKS